MTTQHLTHDELARRWHERLHAGTFSEGVHGLGTIRVMGKTGDAPVQFPRIASLAALSTLAPDEQWAVRLAEAIVTGASTHARTVFAVQPGDPSLARPATPVRTFDPMAESLLVVARVAGG